MHQIPNTFYARKASDDRRQNLQNHLSNVADLASKFASDIGTKGITEIAAQFHDIGKATRAFQDYLVNEGGRRGDVVHSLQGAFFVDELCDESSALVNEIVAMVIAAHHGFLDDGISPDGESIFIEKLTKKDEEKYYYSELKQNVAIYNTKQTRELISTAKAEIEAMISLIMETYQRRKSAEYSAGFALGLFVKYIYSCLIDADRLDAYLFDVSEQYEPPIVDWTAIINVFEKNIQNYGNKSDISQIRQAVSTQCKDAATKPTGIYQLSVPTGGGKTLSSLRFALHHCKVANKKRIIYVIPYLSIIEQTADELRKILDLPQDNDVILEHHSGIIAQDESDDEREIRKLAASRWDKPLIITTMVQFLETVMSAKGSALRKFHNMSDSVIILDEIQSLPIKTVHLFNETVSFLAKICNSTVLLCTATQPQLHLTERENLLFENNPELINCADLFLPIKRTSIVAEPEKDIDAFATFVSEKAQINGNCLAIVNTKKSAREIFDKLNGEKPDGFNIYHLSTSMCPAHREITLKNIKVALNQRQNIICITTQLIEAGVDISFACVVRATAGLDSITQAAGRCNRNGESDIPKEVYIVPLQGENLDRLDDIKEGKKITERLVREHKNEDLSEPSIMNQFYDYYFYKRKNLMDYPTKDNKTLYGMLSCNKAGRGAYKERTDKDAQCFIAHAFKAASEAFSVIDKRAESVVVAYGEAVSLIEKYRKLPTTLITREKLNIIRKLEKFSVSLFSHEMEQLTKVGAIIVLDDDTNIRILSEHYYSNDVGVIMETNPDLLIL